MSKEVNINADLGESFGAYSIGSDSEILKIVTSANVACGFHAGDPTVMMDTVALAKENQVSIGFHPGFPDLQGFGRRPMNIAPKDLAALVTYQIGALQAMANAQGYEVTHMKPHGAMSNMASVDKDMANCIVKATKACIPDVIFLAIAGSELSKAAREQGFRVAEEVFADRNYTDDGNLVSRREANAMIHSAEEAVPHVLRMVEEQALFSVNGKKIPTEVDSICVHGDGPAAVATAKAVREALEARGVAVMSLPGMSKFR